MPTRNKVIWSDGLFVKPHHFQQQASYLEYHAQRIGFASEPFPYGFDSLVVNDELLTLGKFGLVSGSGIMPDGTIFSFPDEDSLPSVLEIGEAFKANEIIYLCLPLAEEGGIEVQYDKSASRVSARYLADEVAVRDHSDSDGEFAAVKIAKAQPKLRMGSEDLSAFTKIAVARITEKGSDGVIRLDQQFFPTMLSINAAPMLRRFLGELADGIEQRAIQIAGRIGQPDQNGVADVSDFMMLQAFNRISPLLRHLNGVPKLHPSVFFGICVQILGEMATFFDEGKYPRDLPKYDHNLPEACWPTVIGRLRQMLTATLAANATPVNLEKKRHGYYLAPIFEQGMYGECEFVLAVKANTPIERIQRDFATQAKASSIDNIQELVRKQLPGIPLRVMPVAPRQLPYHAGFTYFALDRSSPAWRSMANAKGFAFHVAGQFPELEMQFWAIRG